MSFWDRLAEHGERLAIISETASLSYFDLTARADVFCAELSVRFPTGLTRPLIVLEALNEIESVIAYIGSLRAGWPVILVGKGAPESSIAKTYLPNVIIRRADEGWETIITAADPIDMHADLAVLLSTSGTTGAAKLVKLSRQNLEANAAAIVSYLGVRPDDRAITVLPFHYSYGMSVLHIHLHAGAAVVLTEGSLIDSELRGLAYRTGVTSLALVPTQFELLDDISWLPNLRYITQAGGRLDPVLARRFAAQADADGWQLFIMYGQTEAAPRMSYVPPQEAQDYYHTIGRPIPGGTFRLLDVTGAEITASGMVGELVYEGPNVMLGYAVNRADMASPAAPSILHTGDMAQRLTNGYFQIIGRTSRFIKLFGLRIGLDEVETQLRGEGNRVYVVGTDARLMIFVQEDIDTHSLHSQIAARYQLPQSSILVAALQDVPLLLSGKVDYRALTRLAEGMQPTSADKNSIEATLRHALRTQNLDFDRSFLELGGDSLAYLEVQLHFSALLGEIPINWEQKPLRELVVLEKSTVHIARGNASQIVSADLLARLTAILMVIALHSTAWPTGGGAYLLLILTGYSLARFQSGILFEGHILRTWQSMLLPILTCYYILISLIAVFWAPVGIEWFLLLGNFQEHIQLKGLIPYWFVSTYAQIIVLATLPFLVPVFRRYVMDEPFFAGILALAIVILAIELCGVDDILPGRRHRHPLAAMELLIVGWGMFFSNGASKKMVMTVVILLIWWINWLDENTSVTLMVLFGALAVVWDLRVQLPAWAARGLMRVGALTLFIYLVHPPIISICTRLVPQSDMLRFGLVVGVSLVAASALKALYESYARKLVTV